MQKVRPSQDEEQVLQVNVVSAAFGAWGSEALANLLKSSVIQVQVPEEASQLTCTDAVVTVDIHASKLNPDLPQRAICAGGSCWRFDFQPQEARHHFHSQHARKSHLDIGDVVPPAACNRYCVVRDHVFLIQRVCTTKHCNVELGSLFLHDLSHLPIQMLVSNQARDLDKCTLLKSHVQREADQMHRMLLRVESHVAKVLACTVHHPTNRHGGVVCRDLCRPPIKSGHNHWAEEC
mmetsp:Transcript_20824/g.58699  ORF Transcript_20824/g.58699 Transcript_20824/m.58699 type:complete len:235 (+) Transcript_20824:971-1675(+)